MIADLKKFLLQCIWLTVAIGLGGIGLMIVGRFVLIALLFISEIGYEFFGIGR